IVHRDLKPQNVILERGSGGVRPTLIDFGISRATALGVYGDKKLTQHGITVGTPLYMAPEQAAGRNAGPATDLYALGVMLFECLTGALPFSGSVLQVLMRKQEQDAPDPLALVPEAPASWRDACVRLLQRDAERRPTVSELRARLGLRRGTGAPAPPPTAGTQSGEPPFVGRSRESEALLATLAEVRDRRAPVVLHLRGRSGHGKSALLRRFIAALAGNGDGDGDDEAPTVLRGRCRERESVPYKGVDAALDALALHLRTGPKDERDRLRPDYADALVQVFPTFAELWPVARTDFDPQEARSLAWAALREILESLAGRAPVVLVLDDFQWTDPESVSLLRTLCRPPRAPALLLLLITRDLVGEAARRWLEELAATDEPSLRRIELGPLPDAEARALALSLLSARHGFDPAPGGADPLGTRAAAIALRCAGSPFFIQQMVLEQDLDDAGDPILGEDLDQIVIRRLDALPAANRAALEGIAVAGGPIARSRVLTLEPEADAETIVMLCDGGLLVRSEGSDPQVEVAHDRIREAALAALDPQRAGRLHWQLGRRLLDDARKTEDGPLGDSVF
ncbi:MAG: AAA family ATPase, partial [Myxococcales bacterium]|nr:AAA family ATPase [Myxococcales bacterium]